jgi:myo-inositol 2-dehydrogenase/D-chiro-inositol 1-dehydrogenase
MANPDKVKVGIIGSGFEAEIHAAAFQIMPEEAEVVAVASPTPDHAQELAKRYGIRRAYLDDREMLKEPSLEMVTIAAPNRFHARMTQHIAKAGIHVVCEKPLCMTLEEADAMIDICRKHGVLLLYAEELFFMPKYVNAKEMAGQGIAFCYWFLGRPKIKSVYAHMGTYVRGDKTIGEDDSVCVIEFDHGAVGIVENSRARRGGMDGRVEVYGEGGVRYANLHMGNALPTYREYGFGYAVEKAPATKGWTYPVFEELWNYGFPQEMRHFARCVRGREAPQATGEDGRVVMEALDAGYALAGLGCKVALPYRPETAAKPIDGWLKHPAG